MAKQQEKKKLFSTGNIIFYGLVVLFSIFAVYYFSEIKTDIELFGKIKPYWLLFAVLGQIGTYFFGAIVYQQLLLGFHIRVRQTVWKLFKISFITLFFNQTIPSAGISGNTFLFNYLHKNGIAVNNIISLISVELISFYISIEIIIILTVILSIFLLNIPGTLYIIWGIGFVVYFLFGLSVNILSNQHAIGIFQRKIASAKILAKLRNKLQTFFTTKELVERPSKFFREHAHVVYRAVGLQLLIFLSDAFTILALFHGLGLPINILTVSAGFLLTRIVSLLPISPGGLIIYEGGMSYFFSRLGVHFSSALIITLLYRALSFWLPMIIGFFVYRKMRNETFQQI
ncbi:flippase-like domain-containing protein [Niabella sp. CC-SYL272]|uniref:lysylphosphatidylglycerol synthase transmembrane domain-containing protein n=1 Tax=Niabella agricola TaxID=2891571 RepID=UPI001F34BBF2|nr:lysylphosphatidylglycerol synthase transmembrane domain-containing protein [Niabella agricola]MCF3107679.1 flippase-like domain-containing protein [Niabella agricola]